MLKISVFSRDRDDDELVDIDREPIPKSPKGKKSKTENTKPHAKFPNIGGAIKDIVNPYSDLRLSAKSTEVKAKRKVKTAALKATVGARTIIDHLRKDSEVAKEVNNRKSKKKKK